MKSKQYC